MIHLKSKQRLYISKDLRGYVDKLTSDGTVPYAVDFLKLGFAYAVQEDLVLADDFERHEITTNTDILGEARLVMEATAQWYARREGKCILSDSQELLQVICRLSISGGESLRDRWESRTKRQVQNDIRRLA